MLVLWFCYQPLIICSIYDYWLNFFNEHVYPNILAASKEFVLEEPDCKEIPLKEIYAATNNLNSSNFIGQGIAGEFSLEVTWRENKELLIVRFIYFFPLDVFNIGFMLHLLDKNLLPTWLGDVGRRKI